MKKKIFGLILIAIFLIGAPIFYLNSQKANWESDILGQIINCQVGDKIEKTFTLNNDKTFKMMVLPFDVWGNYEVENLDNNSSTADVKFTAKFLHSSRGDRSNSLKNKDLQWEMKIDFSNKNALKINSDDVKIDFSKDEKSANWQVSANQRQIFNQCSAE